MNEDRQSPIVIRPRILPRDFLDVCLGVPIAVFLTVLLFGVPWFVAFFLGRLLGLGLLASQGLGLIAYCIVSVVLFLFTVRRLTVSPDGIHFHRILGSPKFLPWHRISSVGVASRRELILRGWLWPLFPPREITLCLSALYHYRITWDTDFCYYPPAHTSDFEQYVVSKFRNDRNA